MFIGNAICVVNAKVLDSFPVPVEAGALFVSEIKNEARGDWETSGFQLNNIVNTSPPKQVAYALDFTAANSDTLSIHNRATSYTTINFWVKADTATEMLFGFKGIASNFNLTTNTITRVGGSGVTTIYVDDVETTTMSEGVWHHVRIVNSIGVLLGVDLAYYATGGIYGDVSIKDFIMSNDGLSTKELTTSQLRTYVQTSAVKGAFFMQEGIAEDGNLVLDYSPDRLNATVSCTSDLTVFAPIVGYLVNEDERNQYYDFDGINDSISFNDVAPTDVNNGYVEIRLTLPSLDNGDEVFLSGSSSLDNVSVRGNGTIKYNTLLDDDLIFSSIDLSYFDDNFHTIRFDVEGGTKTSLTIDGVLIEEKDLINAAMLGSILTIGGRSGVGYYKGKIRYVDFNNQRTVTGLVGDQFITFINGPNIINVLKVGSTDLFGNTIPAFVGTALPDAQILSGGGIDFQSTNSDAILFGNIGTIGYTSFWLNLDTTTEKILQWSGSINLEAMSGVLTLTGVSGTIKVNGVETTTITTDPSFVEIIANIDANDLEIGRIAAAYGDFVMNSLFSSVLETSTYLTPNDLINQTAVLIAPMCEGNISGAGKIVFDYSGNDNNAPTTGSSIASIVTNYGIQSDLHGLSNYKQFNGSSNAVYLGDLADLLTAEDWELTFNIVPFTLGSNSALLSGATSVYVLYINSGGRLQFRWGGSANNVNQAIFNNTTMVVGNRYDITLSWSQADQEVTATINGVPDVIALSAPVDWVSTQYNLGFRRATADFYFHGLILSYTHSIEGVLEHSYSGHDFEDLTNSVASEYFGTFSNSSLVLSNSPTAIIDVFNNPVQYSWGEGLLNKNEYSHEGVVLGGSIGDLNTAQFSIIGMFKSNDVIANQVIWSNRTAGDGFTIDLSSSKLRVTNEIGAVATSLIGDTTLLNDEWYVFSIQVENDGTANIYLGDLIDLLTSDVTEANIGLIGGATTFDKIGVLGDDSLPFNGYIAGAYKYDNILDADERLKIRNYLITKIGLNFFALLGIGYLQIGSTFIIS